MDNAINITKVIKTKNEKAGFNYTANLLLAQVGLKAVNTDLQSFMGETSVSPINKAQLFWQPRRVA